MVEPEAKPWIKSIGNYKTGKSQNADGKALVKLSSNENPLGCSPAVHAVFKEAGATLARYPDPGISQLRTAIARKYDLDAERIIYGTGSDDILNMAANAYSGPGDENIYVRYGFAVYDIATRRFGATPVIADDKDYGTDIDAVLEKVSPATKVVFIANPNNPTGTLMRKDELIRLHKGLREDILCVFDGAYAEYLEESDDDGALALAREMPNVLVTRTFSKIYGLAAERIGWGYASAPIIQTLQKVRAPFNVTSAGQAAAIAALHDDKFVDMTRMHNARWRQWFSEEMLSLSGHGISVTPSWTNFVLVHFNGAVSAKTMDEQLTDAGYAVRWLPNQGLVDALRVSIGTEEEMRGLVRAMRQILGEAVTP